MDLLAVNYFEVKQRTLNRLYVEARDARLYALFALWHTPLLPELVHHIMLDLKLRYMRNATTIVCCEAEACESQDLMLDEPDWTQPHTMLRWEAQIKLVFSPKDDYTGFANTLFVGAFTALCKRLSSGQRVAIRASGENGLCWEGRVAIQWVKMNLDCEIADKALERITAEMQDASCMTYLINPKKQSPVELTI